MNIFESLENLSVSESCFEDIISIIEEEIKKYKSGLSDETIDSMLKGRRDKEIEAERNYDENEPNLNIKQQRRRKRNLANLENRRAKYLAGLKKLKANPEGTGNWFDKSVTNKELIPGTKNEWKKFQGRVTTQKGKVQGDKLQQIRGLEQTREVSSPYIQKTLDRRINRLKQEDK